jgi:phage shock protein PspC (stress-responsive transcriptional regulator)
MPNDSPNSLLTRAWRGALVLCGIAVLLNVTVTLISRIWVELVVVVTVIALIAGAIAALISWRRRSQW